MNQSISRKEFVKHSALCGLMLAMCDNDLFATPGKQRLKSIGLITNVIQNELKNDWQATLLKVAAIGYRHLEFGKYYGNDRQEFKHFLKEHRLMPLAGGTAMSQMRKEDKLKKMIDDALYLDKKYLVCYRPWMDDGNNKKLDDFKKAAHEIDKHPHPMQCIEDSWRYFKALRF